MSSLKKQKAPKKYLQVKHCIKKMQNKAKRIGVLYFLATLLLIGLACFQSITFSGSEIGILQFANGTISVSAFWQPFQRLTEGDFIGALKTNITAILVATLYSILLIVMLVNFIRACCRLGWLFKRRASKLYGFNRNMYAMDDLEKLFSSTLKAIVITVLFVAALVVQFEVQWLFVGGILGVGVFFHFLCGLAAGNVSLFTVDGEIVEEKRSVGRFSVFIRNLIQVAATVGFVYFFVPSCGAFTEFVNALVAESSAAQDMIWLVIRVALAVFAVVMICYSLGTTEFDARGKDKGGRGSFFWVTLLAFVLSLGAAVFYAIKDKIGLDSNLMAMAGISLTAFVLEICLRKFPKAKGGNPDDVDAKKYLQEGVSEDVVQEEISLQPQILPPVYLPLPPSENIQR